MESFGGKKLPGTESLYWIGWKWREVNGYSFNFCMKFELTDKFLMVTLLKLGHESRMEGSTVNTVTKDFLFTILWLEYYNKTNYFYNFNKRSKILNNFNKI